MSIFQESRTNVVKQKLLFMMLPIVLGDYAFFKNNPAYKPLDYYTFL